MPSSEVMHKYKHGQLHSGSKRGPVVKKRKQAIAIMLSEKREEKRHGGKYPEKKKKTKKSLVLVFDLHKSRGGKRPLFNPDKGAHAVDREAKVALGEQYRKLLEGHGWEKTEIGTDTGGKRPQEYQPTKFKMYSNHLYTHKEKPSQSINIVFPHSPGSPAQWAHRDATAQLSRTPRGETVQSLSAHLGGHNAHGYHAEKSKAKCSLCKGKRMVRVIFKSGDNENVGVRACPTCNPYGAAPVLGKDFGYIPIIGEN